MSVGYDTYPMPQPERWLNDHHVLGWLVGVALVVLLLVVVIWAYSLLPPAPWQ